MNYNKMLHTATLLCAAFILSKKSCENIDIDLQLGDNKTKHGKSSKSSLTHHTGQWIGE